MADYGDEVLKGATKGRPSIGKAIAAGETEEAFKSVIGDEGDHFKRYQSVCYQWKCFEDVGGFNLVAAFENEDRLFAVAPEVELPDDARFVEVPHPVGFLAEERGELLV
jgi:hypothetical protein